MNGLSRNENAIELLEYPEKINYANLSVNSSIFIYDYENDEKIWRILYKLQL